jgi:hypothetical protein
MDEWDGLTERRAPPPKSFWNGTASKLLMILVGLLAFLGTHLYQKVWDMPKEFASQPDLAALALQVERGFSELRDAVGDINKFLRNNRKP